MVRNSVRESIVLPTARCTWEVFTTIKATERERWYMQMVLIIKGHGNLVNLTVLGNLYLQMGKLTRELMFRG